MNLFPQLLLDTAGYREQEKQPGGNQDEKKDTFRHMHLFPAPERKRFIVITLNFSEVFESPHIDIIKTSMIVFRKNQAHFFSQI